MQCPKKKPDSKGVPTHRTKDKHEILNMCDKLDTDDLA